MLAFAAKSKGKKDNINGTPKEVEATAAATSTAKPNVTAFGFAIL